MRTTIETKYLMQHSAASINITFTCRSFYIEKDKIIFNNDTSILLNDIITAKVSVNGYDSVLYDNEKTVLIPTTFNTNFIPTEIDNVKGVLEEIKGSVIE